MSQKLIAALRGLVAVVLMLFATNFLPVAAAFADQPANVGNNDSVDNTKVFVCKYVGTPGTDEVLQTGNNPISVSVNAIKDYQGVGSYFNDAQGRSFVLEVDNTGPGGGQTGEPTTADCPAPQGPTHVGIPSPSVNDPCGIGNATWNVPSDTVSITWTLTNGNLTAHTTAGFVFTDDTTVHNFGQATDSNVLCPEGPQTIPVPHPDVTDPCGEDNATWVLPANNAQVTWTLTNGDLVAHTTANYVFPGGLTSHDFGQAQDSNKECKVFVCKYVGTPGVDERLQTGQNPISVSVNSLKNFNGIIDGAFFNDAQGRSVALAFDVGQAEPDASACNLVTVRAGTVTVTNPTCEVNTGSYTIPSTNGVTYAVTVNGVTADSSAGTHTVAAGATIVVTASAQTGFTLTGSATQNFTIASAKATADCVLGENTGGQGGDVLGATTLANTGQSPWAAIIVGITVISLTLTSAFASRRMRLDA